MTRPVWDPDAASAPGVPRSPTESTPPGGPVEGPATVPTRCDVAIVGGGFTGLWTAYYLLRADPSLDVVVFEAEHVGFGASGRNGGWASALFPVGAARLAMMHGRTAATDLLAALRDTVVEIGDVVAAEGIDDAGYVRGGALYLARSRAQLARARTTVADSGQWGHGTVLLSKDEATDRLNATDVLGGTHDPHCARVQPRALTEGLARAVRARGGRIVEGVRVSDAASGRLRLAAGPVVRADRIVRATEAYTAALPRLRRRLAPVYSLMVATEPIPDAVWQTIGLADREVFSDYRHGVIYGQRTVDDRIAFGGRGAPYHLGSALSPAFDDDERVFALLRRTLRDLLPQLGDTRFTHAWGGPLGIPRDWHPSVGFDVATGIGWAGGYVGDGVAATNLAGRTLADLLTGRRTALTALPWVGHRSPEWEPEPMRWLGVNAGIRIGALADIEERWTGRPARLGEALSALTGH